jgi:phosphomethylpyrimidine synthase
MKITGDVRKFAPEQGITEQATIDEGLKQKATEFTKSGAEIYAKT